MERITRKRAMAIPKQEEDEEGNIELNKEDRDSLLCKYFNQLEPRQQIELVKLMHRMEEPIPEPIHKAKIRVPRDGKTFEPVVLPPELLSNPKNIAKDSPQKRQQPTYEDKKNIILLKDQGISVQEISTVYNLPKSTIYNILKDRLEIERKISEGICETKKRIKVHDQALEQLVLKWYKEQKAQGILVAGPELRKKALEMAKFKGNLAFKASGGWLQNFKARYSNVFKDTIFDEDGDQESDGNDQELPTYDWFQATLEAMAPNSAKKARKESVGSMDDVPPPLSPVSISSNGGSTPPPFLETEDGNPDTLEPYASASTSKPSETKNISGFTFRKVKVGPQTKSSNDTPITSKLPLGLLKSPPIIGRNLLNTPSSSQRAADMLSMLTRGFSTAPKPVNNVFRKSAPIINDVKEVAATATVQIKEEPLNLLDLLGQNKPSDGEIPDFDGEMNLDTLFSGPTYQCRECSACKLPLSNEEYQNHMEEIEQFGRCSEVRKSDGVFPCAFHDCDKTFESMTNYVNHLRIMHGKPSIVLERTFFNETEFSDFTRALRSLGDFKNEAGQKFSMKQHRCGYTHEADDSDVEFDDCEVTHKGRIACSAFFHATIESQVHREKVIHLRYCDYHIHGKMRIPKVVRKRIRHLGQFLPPSVIVLIIHAEVSKYAGTGGLSATIKLIDIPTILEILLNGGISPIDDQSEYKMPSNELLEGLALPEIMPIHHVKKACEQWIASVNTDVSKKIRQNTGDQMLKILNKKAATPSTLSDALNLLSQQANTHPILQNQETRRRQKAANIVNSIRIMAVKMTVEKLLEMPESELLQFERMVEKCLEVSEQKESIKTVDEDTIKPYVCPVCSMSYFHKSALRFHLQTDHDRLGRKEITNIVASFENQFSCLLCDRSFSEYKALKDHQIKMHGEFDVQTTKGIYGTRTTIPKLNRIPLPFDNGNNVDEDDEDKGEIVDQESQPRSPTQLMYSSD